MKKKLIIPISIFLLVLVGFLCVYPDYHTYKPSSKTQNYQENQLIFTLTTFNGSTEKEPFVANLGHSWLSIENHLDHSINLNGYDVSPNETVTFSVWAVVDHFGVFFNLEANFIKSRGKYDGRMSISTNINESDLDIINDYIKNNDSWETTKNCSFWSIHLWNLVVSQEYQVKTQTLIYTPTRLMNSLLEYSDVVTNKEYNNTGDIFMMENGERMVLNLCD